MLNQSKSPSGNSPLAVVPKHVLCEQMQDELMLLDFSAGQYYSLNEVGSRMWALVQEKCNLDEVVATLLEEYEVDEERLHTDLRTFIDDLTSKGFISVGSPPS